MLWIQNVERAEVTYMTEHTYHSSSLTNKRVNVMCEIGTIKGVFKNSSGVQSPPITNANHSLLCLFSRFSLLGVHQYIHNFNSPAKNTILVKRELRRSIRACYRYIRPAGVDFGCWCTGIYQWCWYRQASKWLNMYDQWTKWCRWWEMWHYMPVHSKLLAQAQPW